MNQPTANQQLGLSLIELMIAVTLGTVITLGVVTIYADNLQSYRIQENLSRLQENGRFAMDLLSRDIRMAGNTGCANQPFVSGTNSLASIEGTNGAAGTPTAPAGSDTITVRFGEDTGIALTATPSAATTIVVTAGHGLDGAKKDIIMLSACGGTAHTAVADSTATNTITIKDGAGANAISFKSGDSVLKYFQIEYSINPTGTGGNPELRRSHQNNFVSTGGNPNPVVEGVENMQVLYGYNSGGILNYADAPPTIANVGDVVSIKIALVVASIADNITTKAVPYTMFNNTITPTDRKLRRVFTQTIAMRNGP